MARRAAAFALALGALAVHAGAWAQGRPAALDPREPPASWLPTDDERRSAEERALEATVGRALTLEPGVVRARALVRLPRAAEVALDQELPPAQVALWLEQAGAGPSEERLRALLGAAGLDGVVLRVTRRPPLGSQVLQPTHPRAAAGASSPLTRAVLAVSLAGNVLLATAVLLSWPKGRRGLPRRSKES